MYESTGLDKNVGLNSVTEQTNHKSINLENFLDLHAHSRNYLVVNCANCVNCANHPIWMIKNTMF